MLSDIKTNSKISIKDILQNTPKELGLEVFAGKENLEERFIHSERIQKLGLALAGYGNYLHNGRVQIIGHSEVSYLSQLDVKAKSRAIDNLNLNNTNCILVTKGLEIPQNLLNKIKVNKIPVLRTPHVSSLAISGLTRFLQNALAPKITIHGVMLGMLGLGVLILGESGIGKSECALDLVRAGHSLVSDDSVIVKKIGDKLQASSPKLTFEHIEIRGLGILNVKDLFGVSAIAQNAIINLCIELKKWDDVNDIDRIGIKMQQKEIFDIKIPKFILPVSSGRNITTLVETAVRLHLLKSTGHNAAETLIKKHNLAIGNS